MAATRTETMTEDAFMALADDGHRYELIEGEPKRMSPTGLEHGGIGVNFAVALSAYARPSGRGLVLNADTGFLFQSDPPIVRAPDVAFIRTERLPPRDEWARFSRVLPDLAVEIVSPSDAEAAVAEKVRFYLDHGIALVWVAYPARRQVAVHRPGHEPRLLGVGDLLSGEEILPGFRMAVSDVFV